MSALENIVTSIIDVKEFPKVADALLYIQHDKDKLKELADKLGIRCITNIIEFENKFITTIRELDEKKLNIAKTNGLIPCIEKSTGIRYLAIGNLKAIDLEHFNFRKIMFITYDILDTLMPTGSFSGLLDEMGLNEAKKYVETLLESALTHNANDIHIEPESGMYVVKFALDDDKNITVSTREFSFMDRVIAIMENMARVEVRSNKPYQDGQITISIKGKRTEWRYHEDRTINGKRVVIRRAYSYRDDTSLESLNYPPLVAEMIRKVSFRKNGLILFTGATGMGKSTGMTAILLELKRKKHSFITMIEDSPEVILDGIAQIKVNSGAEGEYKYGYAEAIKASLRADPDVLMVAEIRDFETAKACYQAAQTGHLAFSTLHVGKVADVFDRLIGLGIDAHTIGTYTSGVFAQILVPMLCPNCKEETGNKNAPFRRGDKQSCPICKGSGYKGRVPINECAILPMDGSIDFSRDNYVEYYSYEDTLKMQLELGRIDESTYDSTLYMLRLK